MSDMDAMVEDGRMDAFLSTERGQRWQDEQDARMTAADEMEANETRDAAEKLVTSLVAEHGSVVAAYTALGAMSDDLQSDVFDLADDILVDRMTPEQWALFEEPATVMPRGGLLDWVTGGVS